MPKEGPVPIGTGPSGTNDPLTLEPPRKEILQWTLDTFMG